MPAAATVLSWDAPGLNWDAINATWDGSIDPPDPNPPGKMAQVKLNLDRLNREQLAALAQQIHDAMDGNANYATPNPALATVLTDITALETGLDQLEAARQTAKEKTVEVDELAGTVRTQLTALAAYVQNASGGDEQKILSAGMQVKDTGAPVQMTPVTGLESSPGDDSGEVDLTWDPVRGASSYEIQTSPDPITADSWGHGGISTKSKLTLTGLPTGDRCWFRVRAIGANGNGAWSDPATKVVP
ncbi:MAG: fibronectin type III domain-containing protein [Verrucomicrobiae bacterium]|nr:fibronectin type III domain-containing protein [Verrucomicrobiae bacterium]